MLNNPKRKKGETKTPTFMLILFATDHTMQSLKEKIRIFQVITLSILLLMSCSAGKYPAKKNKSRKMKACDCPTFGIERKATCYYYYFS